MKKDRRWMKSILAASTGQTVALPWQRAIRTKPATLKTPQAQRRTGTATR